MNNYTYPFSTRRLFCSCKNECSCDKFEIIDAKGNFYCGADCQASANVILSSLNNPNAHLNQR